MPSSHLILCRPLLLLPPIPPSIRVFSNLSTLHMRWPKYWSFSLSISPSKEHPGLVSFRMNWLGLLAVQGTHKKSSPAPQFKSINSFTLGFLYGPTFTSVPDYWKNHSFVDSCDPKLTIYGLTASKEQNLRPREGWGLCQQMGPKHRPRGRAVFSGTVFPSRRNIGWRMKCLISGLGSSM